MVKSNEDKKGSAKELNQYERNKKSLYFYLS